LKKSLLTAIALIVSVGLAQAQDGERCKVTDPTGTPLNVRAKPNGKIIGTLANGTYVSILEYAPDANGKPWVKVAYHETKKPIGWVFREFVSCF
jgi:hypothetical protein